MNVVQCSADSGCSVVWPIVFGAVFFFIVLTSFAYTTLLERRFIAFFQQRIGPNRVGPLGFLQPLADGIKLIFKEDLMPVGASRAVFTLAPLIKTLPVLLLFGVIPIGPEIVVPWFAPSLGDVWFRVPLGLADPNVGLLWLLALTSIGTYGIVLAGWSSNNKYAMLGALRASAQMISYELSFGLSLAVPIMLAGSMSLGDMIRGQVMVWDWYVFQNPLAALILIIAVFAETSRAPFDLPEAEQELTQGYQTEYSGMKFAMFMMAEYLAMIAVSALVVATFFGGYNDGFGLVQNAPILGPLVMIGKILLMLILMVWVRATLPRIRYDRLMQFGWKVMLPAALLAVVWTAVSVVIGDLSGSPIVYGIAGGIFFVVVVGGAYLMFGRGGEDEQAEELDPMITGERKGIGYAALNVLGGILAAPFILYNSLLKMLDRLASVNPEAAQEMAIEPVDQDNKPARSSGAD
ncbi:MAG: NADH-quinone oxidoreductase subunit NuoH [Anaerolineae bacterium]|nr:NADH-quinone oxidoreductase subunit NuoH [Anaerolineae bacterium]